MMPLARAIDALPVEGLGWCVGFRLAPLRRLAEPAVIAAMFHLEEPPPPEAEAMILMDGARLLVDAGGVVSPAFPATPTPGQVGMVYAAELAATGWADADVVGLGRMHGGRRVAMAGRFVDGDRLESVAVLPEAPATEAFMHLLAGAGVTHLGGQHTDAGWSVRFVNRLSRHLEAGRAAGFARTALCNDWFLSGCVMGPEQAAGLIEAARDRIAVTTEAALSQASALAVQLRNQPPLCMTCLPPAPAAPFPYGDLVPLGLLRCGVRAWAGRDVRALAAGRLLRSHLIARRQGALWSFETGGLPTATDTAFILLGLPDRDGVAALGAFQAPRGPGIVPQHCGPAAPGVMQPDDSNGHWCRPDYVTTAMTRSLRRDERLDPGPVDWLADGFADRHGLFVANPFLVDLTLALAIRGENARGLAARLTAEILAARNADGSFGLYDTALSTACAVAALGVLGTAPGAVHRGQLALADLWLDEGSWAEATPFQSTQWEDRNDGRGRRPHVTLYADTFRMVTLGLVLLAMTQTGDPLGEGADPTANGPPPPLAASRAHYRFRSPAAYVMGHVVPAIERQQAGGPSVDVA